MKNKVDNSKHYYGLVAEWYDRLLENETGDINYYKKIIQKTDGPILELACGTGRHLIDALKNKADIDGLDSSEDMLQICKEKLKKEGLKNILYHQKIEELYLKRKYNLIFIAGGSFQLIHKFDYATLTLSKIYQSLNKGGRLVLDLFIPWEEIISNNDEVWKLGRNASFKNEKLMVSTANSFDLANQVQTVTARYDLLSNNMLTNTIISALKLRWYSINEFSLLLEKAGFNNISIEKKKIMSNHGVSTVFTALKT
ncbi:MAG: class I SAM-dependent methyltransferase [Chlorobi bacterium]|nr:class I SAM-dependent methyltransferase [Chlorobiota bacterium]